MLTEMIFSATTRTSRLMDFPLKSSSWKMIKEEKARFTRKSKLLQLAGAQSIANQIISSRLC